MRNPSLVLTWLPRNCQVLTLAQMDAMQNEHARHVLEEQHMSDGALGKFHECPQSISYKA